MSVTQKSGTFKLFTAQPRPTRYHRHRSSEPQQQVPSETPAESSRREQPREE